MVFGIYFVCVNLWAAEGCKGSLFKILTYPVSFAPALPITTVQTIDLRSLMEVRLLYDRKTAARMLSISVRSLDYIIAAKGLTTRRIGRKVLVTHASLVQYAKGNHFEDITNRSDADAVASGDKCA